MGTNEVLGLRSIADHNKKGIGETIGMYLKEAWYFEKFWEKLILITLCLLGVVRIFQWVI